jgi:cell division protein FtsQ
MSMNNKSWILGAAGLVVVSWFVYFSLTLLDKAEIRTGSNLTGHIASIQLTGSLSKVDKNEVAKVVRPLVKSDFLSLNLDKIQASVENIPWVRKATVGRVYPDILRIGVEEHKAYAIWNDDSYINQFGEVFKAPITGDKILRLSGAKSEAEKIMRLSLKVRKTLLASDKGLARLGLSPWGSYKLVLDDGMEVMLGRRDIEARLARLDMVLQKIKLYPSAISHIDMRYRHGMAVKFKKVKQNV